MYKVEIDLGWNEKIVIETDDFDKVLTLQAFIEANAETNWEAGWVLFEDDEEENEEDEEVEDADDLQLPIESAD